MGQSPEEDETTALPRDLRFLKTLVTVLTVVMIAGVITITTLLVIRLNASGASVTIAPGTSKSLTASVWWASAW
jgi:heme/copper-type cytochrome/quinol oxidase subunit 2